MDFSCVLMGWSIVGWSSGGFFVVVVVVVVVVHVDVTSGHLILIG